MLKLVVKTERPGHSLAALEAFCADLAEVMDENNRCRLAAALHLVAIEARVAIGVDNQLACFESGGRNLERSTA